MKFISIAATVLTLGALSFSALAGPPPEAATCVACHGADGNPAVPTYPVLAGKKKAFIISQLKKFEAGKMKGPVTVMPAMVKAVPTDKAKNAVAEWYSKQKCKKRCNEPPKK